MSRKEKPLLGALVSLVVLALLFLTLMVVGMLDQPERVDPEAAREPMDPEAVAVPANLRIAATNRPDGRWL